MKTGNLMKHLTSIEEARPVLRNLWATGKSIGSIHTLGALHEGHAQLIEQSSVENDYTIVTIYPNKIQLFPGSEYKYNLDKDIEIAFSRGATHIISTNDKEMYPPGYTTYIDQLELHQQLNSSIFDFASRGQVTGCIRWISLVRPTRSYFGMKDIEQSLLVERAVKDLLIDCEVRHIPCVRTSTGVPVSSRLKDLDINSLNDVSILYSTLQESRLLVLNGERDSKKIIAFIKYQLEEKLKLFHVKYVTIVDTTNFKPIENIEIPFIIHCAISNGEINHFDGLCIRTEKELAESPEVIWLD